MRVLFTKDIARNNQHVARDRPFDELCRPLIARRFDKGVKRPARLDKLELVSQAFTEQVAFLPVRIDQVADVIVQSRQSRLLKRRGRTDKRILLYLGHLFDNILKTFVSRDVTQAPAGHRMRFAETLHNKALLVVFRNARTLAVITELLVNLVGHDENVFFAGNLGHRPHLLLRIDLSGRIAGRIEDYHFRFVRDRLGDPVNGQLKIRIAVDKYTLSTQQIDQMLVHDKVGIRYDHLVTGIDKRHESQ